MHKDSLANSKEAHCTYNSQIKHKLAYMVIDNGNQNNLFLLQLEKELKLPTSTHPNSHYLGCVKECTLSCANQLKKIKLLLKDGKILPNILYVLTNKDEKNYENKMMITSVTNCISVSNISGI